MAPHRDIYQSRNEQDWLHTACALFRDLTTEAISAKGRCIVALSGGSTPTALYRGITSPQWRSQIAWDRLLFLFSDERCVSPDHPESNYGLAHRHLFGPLNLPDRQVYPMNGSHPDPAQAAREYENTIRTVTACPAPAIPALDLILLGMGDDGHTASLFPGTAAVADSTRLVTVGQAPSGIASRLTLTLGVINRATVVLFLVAGAAKAPVVRAVLDPHSAHDQALPAARVRPEAGRVIWLIDHLAGAAFSATHRSAS